MFRPVSPDIDFVAVEEAELQRWKRDDVFRRSLAHRQGATPWIFYEGPPTANGQPGLHHVWARVFKDLFCRYQTMRGRYVARRAGWDTHGLAVEVEVEKKLGISGKKAIEDTVGVAGFTRMCRESVLLYVQEFERLTERIGYWLDTDDAYITYEPEYVDSVWWHLQQLFDRGLIYEDLKVLPYCPRCGTPLSSHELGQPDVYQPETDPSAYVYFPLLDRAGDPAVGGATRLVVWTTTPWTLLSNVGVAVHPDVSYAVVDGAVVAEALVASVFGDDAVVQATVPGAALVGLRYERPFTDIELPVGARANVVVGATYVTTDEGTGLVHLAPAFGEIDREIARAEGLPTVNPVGPDGTFTDAVPWLSGRPVREANESINEELERRGRLLRVHPYVHALPHCWRCKSVLIYWGKPSWYIATSRHKDQLVAENHKIDWHPAHIRDGRFGEWLNNNVDWALSRDRYWGTPLPIWRCPEHHLTCVGSRAQLSELAGRDLSGIDPHRPAIDEVTFPCPQCGGDATRVSPVIDAWFDSGAMPAAQVGYPYRAGSAQAFDFPAQFIAEAIDQTRGWFYSLLAVNVLVFGRTPYEHVLCLGHIVDDRGSKMSKSVGNVLDPWEILDSRGADPLRWWMFAQGSPWTPTRASHAAIDLTTRETLVPLWNTFSFFMTYAALNRFDPSDQAIPAVAQRPSIDRWVLSRTEAATAQVTSALDRYEALEAATAIAKLVEELSNWYVRRTRRRFWRTDPSAPPTDSLAAHATLHAVLQRIALLLAPLCPFLADRFHRDLSGGDADSVHLADWPVEDPTLRDEALEASMAVARRLSSLGRAARAEAGIKVRQPLRRAIVYVPMGTPRPPEGVIEDEINVDGVEYSAELTDVLRFEVAPNFRTLGPRLGEGAKEIRAVLAGLSADDVERLERGESVTVQLSSGPVEISRDDVELRVRSQSGFAASRDGGEVVALDLAIDDDLRRRGLVRDLVRQVQDLRKAADYDVSDRITLHLTGASDLAAEFDYVAREVLAARIIDGAGVGDGHQLDFEDGRDVRAWISRL